MKVSKIQPILLFVINILISLAWVDFNQTLQNNLNRPKCHLVAYDQIRGYLNWHQEWFQKIANQLNIVISESPGANGPKLASADVIIFHAPSHKNLIPPGLKQKHKRKIFAMLSMEQPLYAPVLTNYQYLKQNVDLMITYSLENTYPGTNIPNLPITYYPSHIVPIEKVMEKPKPFSEKTGYSTRVEVVLFTSNCANAGAKGRYKYVEELMSYVQVHSYGKCFKNREEPEMPNDPEWPPVAQRRARKIKVLSNYKFYLAFENSPIDDYVSEKVFEGLLAGSVPVYRGAKRIAKFMPSSDSFIDANDLTPKELADLLKKIGSNEQLYNNYFAFKEKPISSSFYEIGNNSYVHPNVVKRICNYAFNNKKKQEN